MIDDSRLKGLKEGIYGICAFSYPVFINEVSYPDGKLFAHINKTLNCGCCFEAEPLEDYNFSELEDELKEEIILQLITMEEK